MVGARAGELMAASVVGASEVLQFVGILVVSMLAIVAAYHAMQRPRLVLHEVSPVQWRARRRDFWQYVLSMLVLIPLWTAGLEIILLFTNNGLTGQEISAIAVSLVLAVRVLAHVSREHAHELAKSVPLTIVTLLIVTSSGWRTGAAFDETLREWLDTQLSGPASLLVVSGEYVIAALWYWLGVRWWYPRGHDVPGLPVHDPAVVLSHPVADRVTFGSPADAVVVAPSTLPPSEGLEDDAAPSEHDDAPDAVAAPDPADDASWSDDGGREGAVDAATASSSPEDDGASS